jgi:hypothetical protein
MLFNYDPFNFFNGNRRQSFENELLRVQQSLNAVKFYVDVRCLDTSKQITKKYITNKN